MEDNLQYAWERLHDTSVHTFLTGNAGTGKSTLIRKFIAANEGSVVTLAPTGIAAVNIAGQTVHSFFHFPARPISFNSVKYLNPALPDEAEKRRLIKAAKYFIIDEISMVRADLMDQIDWFFKKNFPNDGPFAGKKLIMVGDMDQLPPVVSSESEKQMMATRYESEFFFSAKCWTEAKFETVTLTKVFRQSDPEFVRLLNAIKSGKIAPYEIDRINNSCLNQGMLKPEDGIMLCSTNAVAADVNAQMLARLEGEAVILEGKVLGDFNKKNCTVEEFILLKPGCRVMIMRNCPERTYFNGTIGTFIGMSEGNLVIGLDDGITEITVGKYVFESVEHKYQESSDKISTTKTGEFIQYPVKVAYAISIHKSQGQTFDKVIIDFGTGAFAHGMVYVALSRCTSMQGIILRTPIRQKDLIYHPSITKFNKSNAIVS
jgi:ATP-dependent DNA helicase PIF1